MTACQHAAAKMILTTKDRFVAVQGFAGTGKTYMLQEVKEQAEKHGVELVGMAPSGAAANLLQQETSIKTKTLQKHISQNRQAFNDKTH